MIRRTASEVLRSLSVRIARLEKSAGGYPPANETATDRQGKVSHLLRIILNNCSTLNDSERNFLNAMGALLNKTRGIEPATALSEAQARKLRQIIFKRYNEYKYAVPALPSGVKFEDEVRRLLKSQPNPNQAVNESIEKAKKLLQEYLISEGDRNEWWDGELNFKTPNFKSIEGSNVVFSVEWFGTLVYNDAGRAVVEYEVDVEKETVK